MLDKLQEKDFKEMFWSSKCNYDILQSLQIGKSNRSVQTNTAPQAQPNKVYFDS